MKKYIKPITKKMELTDEVALMAASANSLDYTNPDPGNVWEEGAARENTGFSIWGDDDEDED